MGAMKTLLIVSASKIENPNGWGSQRKCAREKCPNTFDMRGPKLYCSEKCSRNEQSRRRFRRNPELSRAADKRKKDRYRVAHPEWAAACDRRAAKRQTAKRRAISEPEFEAQILAQGNRCPIGDHEFVGRGNGRLSPARDHCHVTDKWRAILCGEHNRALGGFHDSPEELQAAIAYVLEWREKHLDKQTGTC